MEWLGEMGCFKAEDKDDLFSNEGWGFACILVKQNPKHISVFIFVFKMWPVKDC